MTPARDSASERRAEELAVAAQGGSTSSFSELVERFHAPLFRFLRLRTACEADAEEVTQEAFLRAWEKLDRYDPRYRFSTWLYTLARRLAISHGRTRRDRPRADCEEVARLVDRAGDPARGVDDRDSEENLWQIAERFLSEQQCAALWLRYAEDRPVEEVARILNKRAVTVRVLLFRARERLAKHVDPGYRGASAPAEPARRQEHAAGGIS